MNLTACAIEFMKTVGADLYIRPEVPSRTNLTARAPQSWLHVNKMDRMNCLYRHNSSGRIYKSAPTVHEIFFQQLSVWHCHEVFRINK